MTIAKLLLYTYVAIEGVFGVGVSIWACMLLADPNQQAAFSLGVLGAGLLMLFCAVTFYKGMTDTPCLLNLSFLASLLMAVIFSVTGIVLWTVSDQVCEEAEKMLKKNGESCCPCTDLSGPRRLIQPYEPCRNLAGVEESHIQEVEDSLQSAFTALTDIMLLVGGVAASSVILSLRMKNELYEAKEEQEQKLVAMDAKALDKKEREREKWKEKMAAQVAKEEKKKGKR